jgi:hypothetical protein
MQSQNVTLETIAAGPPEPVPTKPAAAVPAEPDQSGDSETTNAVDDLHIMALERLIEPANV